MGTKNTDDDALADWSSRGTTQDGFAKPEVLAPGAHIVSTSRPEQRVHDAVPELHRRTVSTSARAARRWRRRWSPVRSRTCSRSTRASRPTRSRRHPRQRPERAAVLARRGLGQQPRLRRRPDDEPERGNHAEHADQPDHRRDRLHAVALEQVALEPARAGAAPAGAGRAGAATAPGPAAAAIDPTRSRWSRSSWSTSWTK